MADDAGCSENEAAFLGTGLRQEPKTMPLPVDVVGQNNEHAFSKHPLLTEMMRRRMWRRIRRRIRRRMRRRISYATLQPSHHEENDDQEPAMEWRI